MKDLFKAFACVFLFVLIIVCGGAVAAVLHGALNLIW